MRLLVPIAVLALGLAVAPALAAGKSKPEPASLAVLDLCEQFAGGDVDAALDEATVLGWMVSEEPGDTPYTRLYSGFRSFAGVGDGNLWVEVARYPGVVSISCSVGFDMAGPAADAQLAALNRLDWLDGELTEDATGIYGSWSGNGGNPELVQALQGQDGFVLRLIRLLPDDASP